VIHRPDSEEQRELHEEARVKVKYRPAAGEAASRKSKAVSEILLKSVKKMKE
jgi:hypothetical protein